VGGKGWAGTFSSTFFFLMKKKKVLGEWLCKETEQVNEIRPQVCLREQNWRSESPTPKSKPVGFQDTEIYEAGSWRLSGVSASALWRLKPQASLSSTSPMPILGWVGAPHQGKLHLTQPQHSCQCRYGWTAGSSEHVQLSSPSSGKSPKEFKTVMCLDHALFLHALW